MNILDKKSVVEILPKEKRTFLSGEDYTYRTGKNYKLLFKRKAPLKRFLEKCEFDPETAGKDKCCNWIGSTYRGGYGSFPNKGIQKAHRVSFQHYIGEIPKGMLVCHTCDNPACVNPLHLRLGTYKDNLNDMINKGRNCNTNSRGEKNCKAQITEKIVLEIRATPYYKGMVKDLSLKYKVSHQIIRQVYANRTWKHLPTKEELQNGKM